MRIDSYARVVLTFIAVCLMILVLGQLDVLPPLGAQAPETLKRPFPTVITGSNFGFRIDGWYIGKPITGTLLVQVNGVWHEVQSNPSVTPEIAPPVSK
jgi:hypothetical protein